MRSVDRKKVLSERSNMELSERSNTVTQEQIFVIERFIGLVCYRRFLNSIDSERMRNLEYLLHKNL